jgi:hypothetical protein
MAIRNAMIPYQTSTTLEDAWETATEEIFADDGSGWFNGDLDWDDPELIELGNTACAVRRIVAATWQRQLLEAPDDELLDRLVKACVVTRTTTGPVLRSPMAHAVPKGPLDYQARTDLLKDGLTEWSLRGGRADVRACLWCARWFRPDRETAMFDSATCGNSFRQARNVAAHRKEDEYLLLGLFRCVECREWYLIDEFSGLSRLDDGGKKLVFSPARKYVYLPNPDPHNEDRRICRSCVAKNHPSWRRYVLPPLTLKQTAAS